MKRTLPTVDVLQKAQRIVIKIGSALLVGADDQVNSAWLDRLAADIMRLRGEGKHVIIVSSGAIAIGRQRLTLGIADHPKSSSGNLEPRRELRLEEKQAAAAIGQSHLIRAYDDAFAPHRVSAAQLLLTLSITEDRRRYLNARATLETLLAAGAVPIINENDTVATAEIRYGDNDRLAAHSAQMAGADLLILLSDVDGLYTKNPHHHADASHIPHVTLITPEIEAYAQTKTHSPVGTGGMQTKLAAARLASAAGCATVITTGLCPSGGRDDQGPISHLARGGRATLFSPHRTRETARRQWINSNLSPKGRLVIDAGAEKAVRAGSSLLAVGIVAAHGFFDRGETVRIETAQGAPLAKGIVAYHAHEINAIKGLKSEAIARALGYKGRPAIIHRDDLVLIQM